MTKKESLSLLNIVLISVISVLILVSFVFRSYQVDGPSMESTLQNNDILVIWKVARTWARITGNDYIPKRGDVIVFNENKLAQFGQPGTKQLIKRVIGLPGDRVEIMGGHYWVINKQNPNGFDPDKALGYDTKDQIPFTTGNVDVVLGKNQLFVSGDNRSVSLDSRAFGPIDASQIIGKLAIRFWPGSKVKVF
jgi:signal peptidase I